MSEMFDIFPIVGCEIDKTTYVRNGAGGWPIEDFFNIARVWMTALFVDN